MISSRIPIEEIYGVINDVLDTFDRDEIEKMNSDIRRAINGQIPQQQIIPTLRMLLEILGQIRLRTYRLNQDEILRALGIDEIIGDNGVMNTNSLIRTLEVSPHTSQANIALSNFEKQLDNLLRKPWSLLELLKPFEINEEFYEPSQDAYLEVIFDGAVSIDNLREAKTQVNNWYVIIEGYSQLLNIPQTQLEIVSIVKASPTRIIIRLIAPAALVILSATSDILSIAESQTVKQLFKQEVKREFANSEEEKVRLQYLAIVEKRHEEELKAEIEKIVDSKLKEQKMQDEHEVKTKLVAGMHKQYNFIVNGGNVKFYISESSETEKSQEVQQKIIDVEKKKAQLNELAASSRKLKQISEHVATEEDNQHLEDDIVNEENDD